MIGLFLQMLFALALVVGAVVALGAAAKRRQTSTGLMKVVAYQPLGQRKGIAAVQVGGEVLLVGVTPTDVKLLKSVDGPLEAPSADKDRTPAASDKLKVLRSIKERLYAAQ